MARKRALKIRDFPVDKASALRALGAEWLRYEQGCYLISFERSPWAPLASKKKLAIRPDILGLNKQRMTIEVEIKVDKQDFLHDFEKKHRSKLLDERSLLSWKVDGPSQLWYLVPQHLVQTVLTHSPVWAGVMYPSETAISTYSGFPKLEVARKATKLHNSRLGMKETLVMAKDMAGSITTLLKDNVKRTIKNATMAEQIVALGGVIEKPKRKKRTKAEVIADKISKSKPKQIKTKPAVTKTAKKAPKTRRSK